MRVDGNARHNYEVSVRNTPFSGAQEQNNGSCTCFLKNNMFKNTFEHLNFPVVIFQPLKLLKIPHLSNDVPI